MKKARIEIPVVDESVKKSFGVAKSHLDIRDFADKTLQVCKSLVSHLHSFGHLKL